MILAMGRGLFCINAGTIICYANADFVVGLCKVTANVIVRVRAVLSELQSPWIKCSCVPVVLWLRICMLTIYFPALFLFWDFFFPLSL